MVRPWIGCLFGVLVASMVFYFYLLINVPSVEHSNLKKAPQQSREDRIPKQSLRDPDSLSEKMYSEVNSIQEKCDTVHIAMVCAGYNSTFTLVTVVKSILFYRSTPLHFHLLVDEIAKRTLVTLFQTWNLPHVRVTYYRAEEWMPKVSWIPNKHYSGVYGLLKLILSEAVLEDKVLVLDTDVTVLTDIDILWQLFHEFNNDQLIGLVENQSDWYVKSLSYAQRSWPALGRGFNTGVMLMHLQRLRNIKFSHLWETICRSVLEQIPETSLADQDILNAVIKEYPKIIFELHCTWNIQLSDHTISDVCYSNTKKINIIHWNSPRKQNVRNKHIQDFRKMYRVFLELDGNLLRRRLFGCIEPERIVVSSQSDPCLKFTEGASILYRTHLFLLEYEYNVYSTTDVTLVTQCSVDRIALLEELCRHWPGTISVALYLTDSEVHSFLNFLRESVELQRRKNIAYHVVYKEGEFYPVNYLRNTAMLHILTPYVFQLDVDFLPQFGLYDNLMNNMMKLSINETSKTALIVPAFETQRYRFAFPANKMELIKSFNRGIFYTFRYHVWAQGHAATNYSFWRNATEPYEVYIIVLCSDRSNSGQAQNESKEILLQVSWEPDFEPYIVVSRLAPRYDTRFIGFGWNKVSYVTHLTALGYKYIVLPDTFIIHRPHAPSLDIGKFRTDSLYRRCLKKLKDIFVQELLTKYGDSAISKLRRRDVYGEHVDNNQRKEIPKNV